MDFHMRFYRKKIAKRSQENFIEQFSEVQPNKY